MTGPGQSSKVVHLDDEAHRLAKAESKRLSLHMSEWVSRLILESEAAKHRVPEPTKERGFIDFNGMIETLVVLGLLAGVGLAFGVPWLWRHAIKPAAQWAICEEPKP